MQPHKFILSGGGTGGHIFPAVAIAKELKNRFPDAQFLFIGALGRMEMEKIPAEGFDIIGLPVEGLKRSFTFKNIQVIFNFIKSYFRAKKIIRDFKPLAVVGTGGYVSLPVLRAAAALKITTLIWEGNGYAGLSNKLLSKKVNVICTGFKNMETFFPKEKIVFTGNPVRKEIIELPDRMRALDFFKLDYSKPVLFITGGSLGAKTINLAIQNCYKKLIESNIQIIWQTGKTFIPNSDLEKFSHPNLIKTVFLKEMDFAYAAADLVVSRAGALSISEICTAKKAAILIPSPNVTDDHQTKNAEQLIRENAAILISDSTANSELSNTIIQLFQNPALLNTLAANSASMSKPNATKEIVDALLNRLQILT